VIVVKPVAQAHDDKYVLRVFQDENPMNPREDDNLGTMVCFHKRYNLGDKHGLRHGDFESWKQVKHHLETKLNAAVILPLYLLDHSGITMRTDSSGFRAQDPAGWDWGQVGFIYVSRAKLQEEYSVKRVTKKIRSIAAQVLEAEIITYDQYLRGDVYGFELFEIDEDKMADEEVECVEDALQPECEDFFLNEIDSCWGFFGSDWEETGIAEHLPEDARHLVEKLK
jgi:hypothetical protein